MPRLTQAPNIALAAFWADVLSQAGIAASVQRYFLGSLAGEMPPDQCLPEVWISDPGDEPRARALLKTLQNRPQYRWNCLCGETVEGGFDGCWNCGVDRPQAG
ncbi:MAG: DUF2007 domain-containing protein [Polaromonas sp.]|nr:DUF2007 domain-containing protein [Polaromonas sp.]